MAHFEGIQSVPSIAMDPSSVADECTTGGRLLKKASIRLQRTFSRILRDQAQNHVTKDYLKVQANFLRRVIIRRRQLAAKESYNELLKRHHVSPPSSWKRPSVEAGTSTESDETVPNLNSWSIYAKPDLSGESTTALRKEKQELWTSAWATWLASSDKGLKQNCRQLQRWWRGHRAILQNRKAWRHFMNTIGRVEIDETAARQSIALEALSEWSIHLVREMITGQEQILRRGLRSERAVSSAFLYESIRLSNEEAEARIRILRGNEHFWSAEIFPFQRFQLEYLHWVCRRKEVLQWRVEHLSFLHDFLLPCVWTMKAHMLLDFGEGLDPVNAAVNHDGALTWSPSPSPVTQQRSLGTRANTTKVPVHIPFQVTPVPPSSSVAYQQRVSRLRHQDKTAVKRGQHPSLPTQLAEGPTHPQQSVQDSIGALLRSPRLARWQTGMTVGNEVVELQRRGPPSNQLHMIFGEEADGRLAVQDDEETAWLRLVWVWTMTSNNSSTTTAKADQADHDRPPSGDRTRVRPVHTPSSPKPSIQRPSSSRTHSGLSPTQLSRELQGSSFLRSTVRKLGRMYQLHRRFESEKANQLALQRKRNGVRALEREQEDRGAAVNTPNSVNSETDRMVL